jgi:hypothetical protein
MARPRKLPDTIDEELFTHIGKAADGLKIDELSTLLDLDISRRIASETLIKTS